MNATIPTPPTGTAIASNTPARPTGIRRRLVAALLAGSILASGGLAFAAVNDDAPRPLAATEQPIVRDPGYADLVEKVAPAVVAVGTERSAPVARPGDPRVRRGLVPAGLGSGFVVDPSGLVVTNNHVIDGADQVHVTLADGRRLQARIVGTDERTDIALLQVEAGGPLPHVALGDSDRVRVGDRIVAVGNPFGLGGTVTAGIVSARNRDIRNGPDAEFLQLDAAINSGNSGGPTFDVHGRVIGINTAILSPSGGSVGIGFAIPSNQARAVIEQLRTRGSVERGWIGVSIQPVTPDMVPDLGLDRATGVLIGQVTRGGPAMRAGLRPGDVIVAVDGKAVETPRDVTRPVAAAAPGTTVAVTVWRDGADRTLSVTVGASEAPVARAAAAPRG
jgi:serine protease Do